MATCPCRHYLVIPVNHIKTVKSLRPGEADYSLGYDQFPSSKFCGQFLPSRNENFLLCIECPVQSRWLCFELNDNFVEISSMGNR